MAWKFQPCEQIGGDIFNMMRLDPSHYAFYILDVSGHGVPSALVTVSVSQMLRPDSGTVIRRAGANADGHEIVPPSEVLARLDREYPMERFDKFFSIVYMIVDVRDGTAHYSSAGHPPPLLVGADGGFARLDKGGPIIGQGSGLPFEEGRQPLKPGDRIILTTDGVTRASQRGRRTVRRRPPAARADPTRRPAHRGDARRRDGECDVVREASAEG